MDFPPNKDLFESIFLAKVESATRDRVPLRFERNDALLLRDALLESGLNLEINERQREYLLHGTQFRARVSLDEDGVESGVEIMDRRLKKDDVESRWVDIDKLTDDDLGDENLFLFPKDELKDKGFGVVQVLGKEKFADLISKCYQEAVKRHYSEKLGHKAGTEGRGLHQTAADFLALALLDPDSDAFEDDLKRIESRLNTRIWAGFRETLSVSEASVVDRTFSGADIKKPTGKVNGYPPESTTELVRYLTGKENQFGLIEDAS